MSCARALCPGCNRMIHEVEFGPLNGQWVCMGCYYGTRFKEAGMSADTEPVPTGDAPKAAREAARQVVAAWTAVGESPTRPSRRLLSEPARVELEDEIARTLAEATRLANDHVAMLSDGIAKRDAFLEGEGYRRCDIPACNCGAWHRVYVLSALPDLSPDRSERPYEAPARALFQTLETPWSSRGEDDWRDVLRIENALMRLVAEEREACARIAEPWESGSYCRACGPEIAQAIRQRRGSQQPPPGNP